MNYRQQYCGNRRANALILVVGILVILVLVATAFITKTQSARMTASSQRVAAARNDTARFIGNAIADEIASSLFVHPLIPTNTNPQSANSRRGHPGIDWPRWGQDGNAPYNFAPYAVVPWTNPPDADFDGDGIFDDNTGAYNPFGGPSFGDTRWLRDSEPQRADLFDHVGQLFNEWSGNPQFGGFDGSHDSFTHWRHLTNLSRSGNAWRIVPDISDVTNANGAGGLLVDLDIPVEQWTASRPIRSVDDELVVHEVTGFTTVNFEGSSAANDPIDLENYDGTEFWSRWWSWFTLNFDPNRDDWSSALTNQRLIPPNFLQLSNLDGDLFPHELGERAVDAFTRGTARWNVERILTDTDGDGFTDAFWHLSPFSPAPGMRQVVAVSITDNSSMVNANVATRFHRKDYYGSNTSRDLLGEATRGHTPSDIALVAQNDLGGINWRVGFLDAFSNLPGNIAFQGDEWVRYEKLGQIGIDRLTVDWKEEQWQTQDNAAILDELGIEIDGDSATVPNNVFSTAGLNPTNNINSRYGRMWYWQLSGRKPFSATDGFRPYTLADELELRISNGNNNQFVGSRFERSFNNILSDADQVIRSYMHGSHELGEMRDQLDNRQLLFDNRRKLTLFSGSRNDLLPPWLRWDERFWQRFDPDGSDGLPNGYETQNINNYLEGEAGYFTQLFPLKGTLEALNIGFGSTDPIGITRWLASQWRKQASAKVDLREYYADSSFGDPWWESDEDGLLTLAERAPLQLMLAMTNAQESGSGSINDPTIMAQAAAGDYDITDILDTNFGNIATNYYLQTRLMSAGLASNLLAYRDEDDAWRQHSMLPFHYNNDDGIGGTPRVLSNTPLSAAITPPVLGRQGNDSSLPWADIPVVGPMGNRIKMLGLEAQPFILEVFIAHVHKADEWGTTTPLFRLVHETLDTDNDGVLDCPQETVAVVQLANPFDREIDLTQYDVEFFGQLFPLSTIANLTLPPGTPNNPTTLILYSINPDSVLNKTNGDVAEFQREWIDFLDIDPTNHPANTRLIEVGTNPLTASPYWSYERSYYDGLSVGGQNSVALYKWDIDPAPVNPADPKDQIVLIDRLDAPNDVAISFEARVVTEMADEWGNIVNGSGNPDEFYYLSKRFSSSPNSGDSIVYVQWDRATRAWGVDIPAFPIDGGWHNDSYDATERNPRYVFSAKDFTRAIDQVPNGEAILTSFGTPDDPSDDVTTGDGVKYLSAFNWSTFLDPDDGDLDGDVDADGDSDGSLDGPDADFLPDNPDPWFTVESWSPRAGAARPVWNGDSIIVEGEVQGGLRQRKPTYFDMNHREDPYFYPIDNDSGLPPNRLSWSFPDKGWYGQLNDAANDGTTSNDPAFVDNTPVDGLIFEDEWDMSLAFPLQMLQKDEDFEQVGELLNCWLFGHMLEGTYDLIDQNGDKLLLPRGFLHPKIPPAIVDLPPQLDAGTVTTFSEFMYPRSINDWWTKLVSIEDPSGGGIVYLDERVNRLRFTSGTGVYPQMIDGRANSTVAINHPWPRLSIATRVLDSFVCDGPGRPDLTGDGYGDDLNPAGTVAYWPSLHSFYNANNFSGKATPGMININTAPLEVLRTMPHMYKSVHSTHADDSQWLDDNDINTRSLLPESILQWRETANGFVSHTRGAGITSGPNYSQRSLAVGLNDDIGPESVRGFSSPSELGMLTLGGATLTDISGDEAFVIEPWHIVDDHLAIRYPDAWQTTFAANEPIYIPHDPEVDPLLDSIGANLSTDVVSTSFQYPVGDPNNYDDTTAYGSILDYHNVIGDRVSGDSEELNLLQSGISNLITTTSDMFTVHMRIRTFKRNPITGVWDATDLDHIIDDSRYVMLVDRSEVNTPADKPTILYFEKLPN